MPCTCDRKRITRQAVAAVLLSNIQRPLAPRRRDAVRLFAYVAPTDGQIEYLGNSASYPIPQKANQVHGCAPIRPAPDPRGRGCWAWNNRNVSADYNATHTSYKTPR
jgi:hypothetical protein